MDTLLENNLFDGDLIRLGPIDHEKDPEIESRWTHDSSFMQMMYVQPMRPLPASQIKKKYEELEKKADENHDPFPFRIRAKDDDRLIGLAEFQWIAWSNGSAMLRLGIGASEHRGKGYGREALALLLRFGFSELNFYRLTALIPEYNTAALHFFQSAGFVQEINRRKSIQRNGCAWDLYYYGLLADDWRARLPATKGE